MSSWRGRETPFQSAQNRPGWELVITVLAISAKLLIIPSSLRPP